MVKLCEYSPAYQAKIMDAVVFMFEEQHMDFNRIAFELNLKYWIVVEAYKQAKADELIQRGESKRIVLQGLFFFLRKICIIFYEGNNPQNL